MKIILKQKYLDELNEKHNSVTLRKIVGSATSQKLLRGEAKLSLQSYYKICKSMGWNFPDHFEIITDESE